MVCPAQLPPLRAHVAQQQRLLLGALAARRGVGTGKGGASNAAWRLPAAAQVTETPTVRGVGHQDGPTSLQKGQSTSSAPQRVSTRRNSHTVTPQAHSCASGSPRAAAASSAFSGSFGARGPSSVCTATSAKLARMVSWPAAKRCGWRSAMHRMPAETAAECKREAVREEGLQAKRPVEGSGHAR